MARENYKKIKLLFLYELLKQETDEQHPLTTKELVERITKMGIPLDRRVLSQDIETLNANGIEVMSMNIGHEKGYFIADRSFSVPELKILIDSVQAATFVTEKKTKELVDKLATLGGTHRAEILKQNLVLFNTRKHSNEKIYYIVETLEEAIEKNRKVIFRYFDLNEKGEHVLRRDGQHYVVEPVALVYIDDNYYLVSYNPRYQKNVTYRVDRMQDVDCTEETISEEAAKLRHDISDMTEQTFKMFGGKKENITIQFRNSLIGVVYDKFGEDINMVRVSESECVASVNVQVSPTFWGWLFQFVGEMQIISPEQLREEYIVRCEKVIGDKAL